MHEHSEHLSFIHTADVHFGVENYGKIDPVTGIHSRLLDFYHAFQVCIDYAIDHRVDLFLFAGDAYKTAYPTPTQQRLLMHSLLKLFRAKIPVVMIVGNHDHALSFGKAHALEIFGQMPLDGFHVISKPTVLSLTTRHGPVNIVGIPWPSRAHVALHGPHALLSGSELTEAISETVSATIADFAHTLDPSIPAILAGHLTVSSGIFSGSEKRAIYGTDPIFLPSQLAIKPFDYVALGHLHRYQNLNPSEYPAIVYSGSIERIDFGEHKEEKGFCHVTIPEKGNAQHTFVQVPTRPFLQIHVSCKPHDDITARIIEHLARHDLTDAVIKIIYSLPAGVSDQIDMGIIQSACRGAHYIAGIIPIRSSHEPMRRLSQESRVSSFTELLTSYLQGKTPCPQRTERLLKKITSIAAEEGISLNHLNAQLITSECSSDKPGTQ